MSTKQSIEDAVNYFIDELDADPRHPAILALRRIAESPDELPDAEVRLSAVIQPNGIFKVTDQHGREVAGVRSVGYFIDNGQPVFQLNL